ncbi:hypothetical protein MKW94_013121 [Papaver nudicaule]|uniref:Aminotransferase-like plant mobile domain-containing protein n=1 Tax=Papaver nudicaule TaxID=74823 RepID=A0AA41SLT9_PAPNU|nr:hypothetical protein [Papaver nudicaule]MCL7038641.1 hypothetical protein [Papaver nudicaule]
MVRNTLLNILHILQILVYQHRGSSRQVVLCYEKIKLHSPRVFYLIDQAEWGRFLTQKLGESPHSLIDYLVERWWDTTQSFHFPFGEMRITPLNWVALTGLSIGISV